MIKRGTLLLTLAFCDMGTAQVSGFVSSSYQSHGNPLYNYEQIGDRVYQGYLELGFATPCTGVRYTAGLALFDVFTDRNYLDHTLRLSWHATPAAITTPQPEDTAADGDQQQGISESLDPDKDSDRPDPIGLDAVISAKFSARHDKESFKEYDNYAASVEGALLWGLADMWNLSLTGEAGYRRYPFIDELSNATGVAKVELRWGQDNGLMLAARVTGGLKYFTRESFDTARFEAARTYIPVKKQGAGKGGAIIVSKQPSEKQILSNANVLYTTQISPALFVRLGRPGSSLEGEFLYRYNPASSARVIARTEGTATINEDLYNDYFSYSGPEARLAFRQTLPAALQASISLEHQLKRFSAPALRLDGTENALSRMDVRRSIELYVSRWVALSETTGLDIALSASVFRNESNDEYNDFSAWTFALSTGLGF